MLLQCWSKTSKIFAGIIYIFLFSILPSRGVLSQGDFNPLDSEEPASEIIRLVGDTKNAGRLEIYFKGEWGNICNNSWSKKEADVACRNLGLTNGEVLLVPEGNGNILLDNVICTGEELSILHCSHDNFEPGNCKHNSVAGVTCNDVVNSVGYPNSDVFCDFEAGTCGFTNVGSTSYKWLRNRGRTPSSNTGPSSDHTYGDDMGVSPTLPYWSTRRPTSGHATRTFGYMNFTTLQGYRTTTPGYWRTTASRSYKTTTPGYWRTTASRSYGTTTSGYWRSTTTAQKGYYMYTEASPARSGNIARLEKSFNSIWISGLAFWYHMYGATIGTLKVIVKIKNVEKTIWTRTGNQGTLWQYACIPVHSFVQKVIFEGKRGSSYTGDIAIDDISYSNQKCSGIGSVSCTFNNGKCGYQTLKGNDSIVIWSTSKWNSIPEHSGNKTGKYMSVYNTYGKEGMKTYLISPPTEANVKMKLEFLYYMNGPTPGELQVSFKDMYAPLNSWDKNEWQDNGDHGTRWNYGCMDLYPDLKENVNGSFKRVVFTGITGTIHGISLALDDIKLSNGSCGLGIGAHVCTFDNPKLCHYAINCTALQEYTWRRMRGPTSSYNTGPRMDASKDYNGYYLYAEGSYGKAGDAVSIKFPVKNTKGKYLKLNYHMYGQSMGSLHVFYTSGQSSREVWQMSGNQGNVWNFFCRQINEEIDGVKLVAVRGSRYTSDIAVDNVFVTSQPCPNSVDCTFENGMCNYTMTYNNYRYKWTWVAGTDHTYGSGHYLSVFSRSGMEGTSTSITTPVIQQTSNTSSIQFYYKQQTAGSSKLMVEIERLSTLTSATIMESKFFKMKYEGWVMGCIDLPANERVSVNFTSVSGPRFSESIMLDDISYNESRCVYGIVNNICTFEEPNVCGYNVSCRDATKFLWKRTQRNSSSGTGPSSDHSGKGGRYFMYTESSFGGPGDTTELMFPEFVTPPGHYLSFYYTMNGRDIGTLQVHVITRSGNMLKWSEKGDIDQHWLKGCVNLPVNETTTVVFTGIRGNGPLGDMAIDDVGVVPGVCYERGIPCEFMDEMICGYRTVSQYQTGWVRQKSISGYSMVISSKNTLRGRYGLISPLENLTDTCIQISYRIIGNDCRLEVSALHNNKKSAILRSLNDTAFHKMQLYVKQAMTRLILEASLWNSWRSPCSVEIEKIELNNGTCPALVCSNNTRSCKDQSQCLNNSNFCNRYQDCIDNSDEIGCPRSISCNFEQLYLCGYNFTQGWYHTQLDKFGNPDLFLNNSAYSMSLNSGKASIMSPNETIEQSCLQFHYAGGSDSSLEVIAHYSDGRNLSKWSIDFTSQTKWTLGQFQLAAGNVYLEFVGKASHLGLMIDNVNLQNGICGKIVCPNDMITCVSNEKCVVPQGWCNRISECNDSSDEVNCPVSLACDVEHPYQCGYEYDPGTWTVRSGRKNNYPSLDHSPGLYSGYYFSSRLLSGSRSRHDLHAPTETLTVDACLTFYYSFHGSGELEIFDNGVSMLKIRPNRIDTWQKSQIQLSPGKHNITFSHIKGNNFVSRRINILALDSIAITNGTCGFFECEKGWKKCPRIPVCIPKFKFCDHEVDCSSGEDENNCQNYSNIRLVGGRSIHQGYVELYHQGYWNKTCGTWYERNAAVVCRELGYKGKSRTTFKTARQTGTYSYIRSVSCHGFESTINNCSLDSCNLYCYCIRPAAVDCSDTQCESTHVPCANYSATNTNSSTLNTTRCIPKESVCDGEYDCPGGTDEKSCPKCKPDEFQCLNYECIPDTNVCDGVSHCQDRSDEYHCFKHNNLTLSFMMKGKFIPVCEDNLKDQDIANKLCHYVGKGNASVGISNIKATGVKFSYSADAKQSVLPDFKPSLDPCTLLSLNCSRRECGTRSPNLYDPTIQHGHFANPGEFPWQVSLHYRDRFSCGGVLISPRYIITAAHCVMSSAYTSNYNVFVGSNLRYGGQRYNIKKIMSNKKFSMSHLRNDIAVLELDQPVPITDYARPVCLPSKPWVPYTECFLSGWGRNENLTFPDNLKETKVYLLPNEICAKHYKNVDGTTFCANHKNPNQPGCYGDSGGPLVCRNKQGLWELYGIVSYGKSKCAGHVSSPQVFADVFNLRNWLFKHISF